MTRKHRDQLIAGIAIAVLGAGLVLGVGATPPMITVLMVGLGLTATVGLELWRGDYREPGFEERRQAFRPFYLIVFLAAAIAALIGVVQEWSRLTNWLVGLAVGMWFAGIVETLLRYGRIWPTLNRGQQALLLLGFALVAGGMAWITRGQEHRYEYIPILLGALLMTWAERRSQRRA